MKILITVATYYPKKDGVSAVTQYLAEGLAKRGHEIKVITSSYGIDKKSDVYNGVSIKRINLRTRFGLYFGDKKEYKRTIEREVRWADVMINVCTQNAFTDVIIGNLERYDCKKVLYMHGMFDFRFRAMHFSSLIGTINKIWKEARWFFYYKMNKKRFKRYDSMVQLHEKDYGNNYFKKNYGIESIIIENAVDDIFFKHQGSDDFVKPFDKYLVYVANYNDGKNQKLAIREFLKSDISDEIGLVLIGSKKNLYYEKLIKYVERRKKKMGLDNKKRPILLLHDVPRNQLVHYLSNAYLSLMTSKWEVFPVSIIESIACGVPFISTDVGIVKYLSGGVVSENGEIHSWIEKLVSKPKMREELVKLCKETGANCYKIENKVDLLEKEIMKLMQDDEGLKTKQTLKGGRAI